MRVSHTAAATPVVIPLVCLLHLPFHQLGDVLVCRATCHPLFGLVVLRFKTLKCHFKTGSFFSLTAPPQIYTSANSLLKCFNMGCVLQDGITLQQLKIVAQIGVLEDRLCLLESEKEKVSRAFLDSTPNECINPPHLDAVSHYAKV